MIIRGGENIYPREIEEFLYQMPGIKDVQVAGVPSNKYGEAVGAFIILHEGYTMNEFDVREFCQGKIARYKIPKYIFFIKEFPMTGSGKIQKFKLKDLGLELCKQKGIEIICFSWKNTCRCCYKKAVSGKTARPGRTPIV